MSFRDLEIDELDETEGAAQLEDLEARIAEIERALVPFEQLGAFEVLDQIAAEHARQLTGLAHAAYTAEQLWQARGRVQALAWVLARPEDLRAEMRLLLRELAALTATEDEEETVGT